MMAFIINSIQTIVYYSTLVVSMTGVIFYIGGIKKGKQIAVGSGLTYLIVTIIGYCLK